MTEPSEHCLCDNCSGQDCGQDNPEEYEKEQEKERAGIRQAEREKVLDKVWNKCNEIERYEHTDTTDREYCGGERILPLNGLTNSLYSVLADLRHSKDGEPWY
jgi:hypothetical protein